jgi:hypothetical protein
MKRLKRISLLVITIGLFALSFTAPSETIRYKCLIQLKNYTGEGAYIITSLLDSKGNYVETLYIMGEDDEWYHEIDEWWSYFGRKKREVDGITGATLSGGERKVITFEVDKALLDKGYKIRFETSVEDQKYHPKDVEVPLSSKMPAGSIEGTGYIRYVRIMPN